MFSYPLRLILWPELFWGVFWILSMLMVLPVYSFLHSASHLIHFVNIYSQPVMNWIIWRCQSWIRNSSCPEFSYMIYLNKTNSKRKDTITLKIVAAVQLLSCVWLFVASWDAAHQASLSITISQSLFRFMCIESVMLSNHLIRLPSPSSFALILSQHQGLFQWVGSSHQVAKGMELQHQSFQWILSIDFL